MKHEPPTKPATKASPIATVDATLNARSNLRIPLTGIFIITAIFGLYFGREFLLPVAMAFLIALTFRPTIRFLANHHMPPWLAATAFMTALIGGCLMVIYFLIDPITALINDAPHYAEIFADKVKGIRSSVDAFVAITNKIQSAAAPAITDTAQEVVVRQSALTAYVAQITGYSASAMSTIILTLVIAGFLMASGDLFYAKLVRVLPTLTDKKRALRIVYDVEREVSSYLLIVTAINMGLGVCVAGTFYGLGMPMPLLWGFLVFSLNFIPYLGAACGIGLSAFMALVTFDSLGFALLVPLSYAIWNGIENQFVSPLFLSRRLQLNSVAILLALAFWTWIWGIAGTMMAVPILVTFKVFCDHLESLAGIGEFLSEKHPEDD